MSNQHCPVCGHVFETVMEHRPGATRLQDPQEIEALEIILNSQPLPWLSEISGVSFSALVNWKSGRSEPSEKKGRMLLSAVASIENLSADVILGEPSFEGVEALAVHHMFREELKKMLDGAKVDERHKEILRLRFGLIDGHPHTLEEVGREFGVTRDRIRQIQVRALSRLRIPAAKLEEYLSCD